MNTATTRGFRSFVSIALFAFAAHGCGKAPAEFQVNGRSGQIDPGCTAGSTLRPLRILVMVDNSGSTDSTDPSQTYRVQTLRTFLAAYGSHANLSYGFGYFDDSGYLYDVGSAAFREHDANVPFGSATQIGAALDTYHASIPPSGNTAYGEAFSALSAAVTRDEAGGSAQDYAVVFMSDGQPTDIDSDVTNRLTALVTNLRQTAAANGKSHLTVSTVYFGSGSDATSIRNLRTMAEQGGGQFVDTNHLDQGGLAIDDLVTIPGC